MASMIQRPSGVNVGVNNPGKTIYIKGNENTDGSFRIILNAGNMLVLFEVRVAGTWVSAAIEVSTALEEGQVLKADADGILVYAGATVDPINGQWTFDKSINVPSGTVNVGEVLGLSEGIAELVFADRLNNSMAFGATSKFDTLAGSDPTRSTRFRNAFTNALQPVFTDIITANPVTIQFTGAAIPPDVRLTNQATLKANSPMSNVRIKISDNVTGLALRYIPSKESWETETDGISFVTGDNVIFFTTTLPDTPGNIHLGFVPFLASPGQVIDVELRADSVDLLGDAFGNIYVSTEANDGTPQSICQYTSDTIEIFNTQDLDVLAFANVITVTDDLTLVFKAPITSAIKFAVDAGATLAFEIDGVAGSYNWSGTGALFSGTGTLILDKSFSITSTSTGTLFDMVQGDLDRVQLHPLQLTGFDDLGTIEGGILSADNLSFEDWGAGLTLKDMVLVNLTFLRCSLGPSAGSLINIVDTGIVGAPVYRIMNGTFTLEGTSSVLNIDPTISSGSLISIVNNKTIGGNGLYNASGLNQKDPRVVATIQNAEPNSKYRAFGQTNDNVSATSITSNTYDVIDVTGFVDNTGFSERFELIDAVEGIYEYTGIEPFSGVFAATLSCVKAGASRVYNFIVSKNGATPSFPGAFTPVQTKNVGSQLAQGTFLQSIELVTGDTVQLNVAGVGTSTSLLITDLTISIED